MTYLFDFREATIDHSYSTDVLQWTSTDVRAFLLDKQLNQMMPICKLMNGIILIELYKMCITNSPSMLQMLRAETMELHSTPLSIHTYLTFLQEMRHLVEEEKI
jgi:hypothetical protein